MTDPRYVTQLSEEAQEAIAAAVNETNRLRNARAEAAGQAMSDDVEAENRTLREVLAAMIAEEAMRAKCEAIARDYAEDGDVAAEEIADAIAALKDKP